MIPGVHSSQVYQESCSLYVSAAESTDSVEEVPGQAFEKGIIVWGITALTAEAEGIDDQILSQYSLGLIRAVLLKMEGEFSELEYQLFKLPFKTGNTWLMQKTLSLLQRRIGLPEGFMSEEYLQLEKNKQEKERQEVLDYKEQHIYGRYYQTARANSYLDIQGNGDAEQIWFSLSDGKETAVINQSFWYKTGTTRYTTEYDEQYGRSDFEWTAEDTIIVTKGGFESPATYIKPNETDFIFPDSSERKLTAAEISALDEHDRWIAKNEIYARHNYPFQNQELQMYFAEKRWYKRGEYPTEEFREESLSETEQYNIDTLEQAV